VRRTSMGRSMKGRTVQRTTTPHSTPPSMGALYEGAYCAAAARARLACSRRWCVGDRRRAAGDESSSSSAARPAAGPCASATPSVSGRPMEIETKSHYHIIGSASVSGRPGPAGAVPAFAGPACFPSLLPPSSPSSLPRLPRLSLVHHPPFLPPARLCPSSPSNLTFLPSVLHPPLLYSSAQSLKCAHLLCL
jgi:hypothetical protein